VLVPEHDFPAIQQLSRLEGWSTPLARPDAALQGWRASWPALVAVTDTDIIAFLRAISDGAVTTYVAELCVAQTWRGTGLGIALLAIAQRLCPGTRLDLLSTASSHAFYCRAGFREFTGFRRSWDELDTS
jgi:GNAT superfamily N-acetyltransferase